MKKAEIEEFRGILNEKREDVIGRAEESRENDMTLDSSDLPDEIDLASSEYIQSFTFRLRGRDRTFLKKIDKALKKLENGEFGVCESCEEMISNKRLKARPETTLCINCKEDEEREEKAYN